MKFSERFGLKKVRSSLQIDSIDEELLNTLWNVFDLFFLSSSRNEDYISTKYKDANPFFKELWFNFFKFPLDSIPDEFHHTVEFIRNKIYETFEWYEVYDFIEFAANSNFAKDKKIQHRFIEHCNGLLKREVSAVRFLDNKLVKINSEEEIQEIESALISSRDNKLKGVHIHLKNALEKLSDRKSPDYRNSIKESISAIESICIVMADSKKIELGKALKLIKDKIGLHPALEQGFIRIYGYTSDSDGIRHALMDEDNLDFEDAKYMLVSSSAFINYLMIKSQKAGIKLN
jgi:hypothetical protein